MAKKVDHRQRIIDAALALAAERPWSRTSLADIAERAGEPLLTVHANFRSKTAILEAFHRQVDAAVLAGAETDASERRRDRLFDTLMRRFDALSAHKPAIRAMARDLPADPVAALAGGPSLLRSMAWMLEASGVSCAGWRGLARTHLLTGIYLSVLRVWLDDDSADAMKTMAALDRRLRGAASWLGVGERMGSAEPSSGVA